MCLLPAPFSMPAASPLKRSLATVTANPENEIIWSDAAIAKVSRVGRAEDLRAVAAAKASPVAKARAAVSDMKAEVAKQRANLAPKVKDRNDVSAAMLRSDMRQFLRTKSQAEIAALAA